ncbi:hypothetical protein Bca52824_022405 [Brassica carinata]|uniref:glycerophosphodiester phosphodiesterase n=1 Tax=Brassica carinata TaxID=52824 RepID=A0A8X7VG13_BRACI|nr:hypothetical protein Bca52824_022405 [Brassica carinata]
MLHTCRINHAEVCHPFSFHVYSCVAAPKTPAAAAAVPAKKWLTLNGKEPGVVARGGFSGIFPESSVNANDLAISSSSPGLTLLCSLQMTKDGAGICLSDIRLDNATTISTIFPKGQKTYKVNGQNLKGWFALDYLADTIFSNVSLVQNIFSRPSIFDGQLAIAAVEEVLESKPPKFWLSVQNAAYLASKKGLGIVDAVKSALTKSTLDKKVLIQSDDSSVLDSFKDVPQYTRVLSIDKEIGDAPKPTIEEIKKHADAVNILRSSLVTISQSFATGKTKVVEAMHKGNISVYVSVLRNEYLSITFDYFSDPTVELATFIAGNGVDGVITEFPATATRYLRSPCSDLYRELPFAILPAEAGTLISVAAKEAQPPATPPNPPLDAKDVIDPPLPPVANLATKNASGGAQPASSGTTATTANLRLSFMAILALGLLLCAAA